MKNRIKEIDPSFLNLLKVFDLQLKAEDITTEEDLQTAYSLLVEAKSKKEKTARALVSGKPERINMKPDQCKKLCNKIGVEYMSGFESRISKHTITNEVVDRYGDIVRAKGVDYRTTYYPNNPVILYSHDHSSPLIGNTLELFLEKSGEFPSVVAHGLFMDDRVDASGRADIIYRMVISGFMRGCSIGFIPKQINNPKEQEEREKLGLGNWGVEFSKSELLEWSPCNVPANPQALENHFKSFPLEDQEKQLFTNDIVDKMFSLKVFEDDNCLDMFREKVKDSSSVNVFDFQKNNNNQDIKKQDINVTVSLQCDSLLNSMKVLGDKIDKSNSLFTKILSSNSPIKQAEHSKEDDIKNKKPEKGLYDDLDLRNFDLSLNNDK